jgi:hypothetical protein
LNGARNDEGCSQAAIGALARPTARAVLSILTEGWRERASWLLLAGASIVLGGAGLRASARAGQPSR